MFVLYIAIEKVIGVELTCEPVDVANLCNVNWMVSFTMHTYTYVLNVDTHL